MSEPVNPESERKVTFEGKRRFLPRQIGRERLEVRRAILAVLIKARQAYDRHEACRRKYEAATGINWFDLRKDGAPKVDDVVPDYVGFAPPFIGKVELYVESGAARHGSAWDFHFANGDLISEGAICLVPQRLLGRGINDFQDAELGDVRHSPGREDGITYEQLMAETDAEIREMEQEVANGQSSTA